MIACMLHNTATNRFHPIFFREAPMPGNADADMAARRYKSHGHHTEGFDTEAAGIEHGKAMCEKHGFQWDGRAYGWDGIEVPAMVEFFPNPVAWAAA